MSKFDGKSFSVVANGRIVTLGDLLDGMIVTTIDQSEDAFLSENKGLNGECEIVS